MAFSELETKRIEKLIGGLCRRRTRPELAEQLRLDYAVKGQAVTVFEERPDWRDSAERLRTPVAKLRYVRTTGLWSLSWMRADLKWHRYRPAPPSADLAALVDVVDEDTYNAFFG